MKEDWQIPLCECNFEMNREYYKPTYLDRKMLESKYRWKNRIIGEDNYSMYRTVNNRRRMPRCKKCGQFRWLIDDVVLQALYIAKYGKVRDEEPVVLKDLLEGGRTNETKQA